MPPSPHRYVHFWDFRLFNPNSLNFMAPIHVYKRQLSQMICWLADGLLMSKQDETGIINIIKLYILWRARMRCKLTCTSLWKDTRGYLVRQLGWIGWLGSTASRKMSVDHSSKFTCQPEPCLCAGLTTLATILGAAVMLLGAAPILLNSLPPPESWKWPRYPPINAGSTLRMWCSHSWFLDETYSCLAGKNDLKTRGGRCLDSGMS